MAITSLAELGRAIRQQKQRAAVAQDDDLDLDDDVLDMDPDAVLEELDAIFAGGARSPVVTRPAAAPRAIATKAPALASRPAAPAARQPSPAPAAQALSAEARRLLSSTYSGRAALALHDRDKATEAKLPDAMVAALQHSPQALAWARANPEAAAAAWRG